MPQPYPRVQDKKSGYYNLLDDTMLVPHTRKIPVERLKQFILDTIQKASRKSGRQILSLPSDATPEEEQAAYEEAGWELFKYFREYAADPAATAHKMRGRNYRDVAAELFYNKSLQKERMNSAWRYQYLVVDCAEESQRFKKVSDLGLAEADFNAVIELLDRSQDPLSLYVSVKDRSDTMGGQDWPKAIRALEDVAKNDKNRVGPYCCVFGIAMDPGTVERQMIHDRRTKKPHSVNTELWRSNYFWPFFANYSYEEIMLAVLGVLAETDDLEDISLAGIEAIPEGLLKVFGFYCQNARLVDEDGYFNDPCALVEFFCSSRISVGRRKHRV